MLWMKSIRDTIFLFHVKYILFLAGHRRWWYLLLVAQPMRSHALLPYKMPPILEFVSYLVVQWFSIPRGLLQVIIMFWCLSWWSLNKNLLHCTHCNICNCTSIDGAQTLSMHWLLYTLSNELGFDLFWSVGMGQCAVCCLWVSLNPFSWIVGTKSELVCLVL